MMHDSMQKQMITLLSLNAEAGRFRDALLAFVRETDADVYCFQEVFDSKEVTSQKYCRDLMARLRELLPGHVGFFVPNFLHWTEEGRTDKDVSCGNAMFVRADIVVSSTSELWLAGSQTFTHGDVVSYPRVAQLVTITTSSGPLVIANVHGFVSHLPIPNKRDTPERERQSRVLIDAIADQRAVICGDFNAWPDTRCMQAVGQGRKNLIAEYGIMNTRTKSDTLYPEVSDYLFVPKDAIVHRFSVIRKEVSDHYPLLVDFSL